MQPAVKPLALLLHLVILSLPCSSAPSPGAYGSASSDSTAASANGHQEQLVNQTNAACPSHDTASLLSCLQAAQQPVSQPVDVLSAQQKAEKLVTLMHSALVVLKLATIATTPESSQASQT